MNKENNQNIEQTCKRRRIRKEPYTHSFNFTMNKQGKLVEQKKRSKRATQITLPFIATMKIIQSLNETPIMSPKLSSVNKMSLSFIMN